MSDNIPYFFNKVDEVFDEDYIPTDEDLLMTRCKTIGISRQTISVQDHDILLIDLGGQMSERGKYNSIKEEVDALIYTISLCDYNRIMYENASKSRKDDQIELFNTFIDNDKFGKKTVFLVCNKVDKFKEKIKNEHSFKQAFPDFQGDDDNYMECASCYIGIFESIAESKGIKLIPFVLSAVDKDNVTNTMYSILNSFSTTP